MNWYYAQGDQRNGPVTESEFEALIAAGTINESTLVWREGMANWATLKEARPAGSAETSAPAGWIRCTATGRYFPPEEIVYIDGKPYSAAAKAGILQGVMQSGAIPSSDLDRNGPAWERREELGFFPAIWQTVRAVLTEPVAAFTSMKREGGLGNPMGYFVLLYWVGTLFTLLYNFGLQMGTNSFMPGGQKQPFPFPMAFGGAFMIGMAVFMPVFLVIGSFISAGILHLSLMICQGAKQPFETTYRVYCYAKGSSAPLLVVPICGAYVAWIWAIVCTCIGIARSHDISTGRAVLAVLLPMGLCLLLLIGFFVILGFAGAFAAQSQGHH